MFSKEQINKTFSIILLLIYLSITLISVFHHEIWRDEAQVWLVSRDLNFLGIIDHVRNEGHPLLWYFLVLPFAKLNLPVLSMQIISWIFMAFAAGFLIFKAPFNKLSKICILFSAGFLYWLSVISRNYSLIPIFLFLTAYFYPKQKEHPYFYATSVALLSQTHILMCGFCTGLMGLFGFENLVKNKSDKKNFLYSFLIMLVSISSLFLYIITRPDDNISIQRFIYDHGINIARSFLEFFLNLYGGMTVLSLIIAVILILSASIIIFKENKKLFLIYIFSFIYQFFVYICVWQTSPEKAFTFLLTIAFCFWIILNKNELSEKKKIIYNIIVSAVFLMSFQASYQITLNDINFDYSGSKKTAEFIKDNIDKNAVIVSNNPLTTAGIFAYLPQRKFYSPNYKDFYTLGFGKDIDLSVEFKFEKEKQFKNEQVYYLYSGMGEPQTDKKIIFKSPQTTLIPTEMYYIVSEQK